VLIVPQPVVRILITLAAFVPTNRLHATETGPAQPITDCRSTAATFERSGQLPTGLLLAIGQVESGRADPLTGRIDPWPWTTNLAGEGHFFGSAQEAVAWTAAQQAAGSQSIDVGCFQVNLHYHPTAFGNVAEAFDPTANAQYAAAYLHRLYGQTGDWPSAIALYHSSDPFEGQRYSSRVMQAWRTGATFAVGAPMAGLRRADSVVVKMTAVASGVRVVVPDWASAATAAPAADHRAGLPRVFVPGL
jgi:hypothetical protein